MRQKRHFFVVAVLTLAVLFSLAGLFTRNACCSLVNPDVDVTPSEVVIGQEVLVTARIIVGGG